MGREPGQDLTTPPGSEPPCRAQPHETRDAGPPEEDQDDIGQHGLAGQAARHGGRAFRAMRIPPGPRRERPLERKLDSVWFHGQHLFFHPVIDTV